MMLARSDVSGAADALAAMRGAELRQWCAEMRSVTP
jgi:hypothetical protein